MTSLFQLTVHIIATAVRTKYEKARKYNSGSRCLMLHKPYTYRFSACRKYRKVWFRALVAITINVIMRAFVMTDAVDFGLSFHHLLISASHCLAVPNARILFSAALLFASFSAAASCALPRLSTRLSYWVDVASCMVRFPKSPRSKNPLINFR